MSEAGPSPTLRREIWTAILAVHLLIPVFSHLPVIRDYSGTLVSMMFLGVPLFLGRGGSVGLDLYGLTWRRWRADLAWFLAAALLVFPLYLWLYLPWLAATTFWREGIHDWGVIGVGLWPRTVEVWHGLSFRLPPGFAVFALTQFLAVALPEELFYRGYLLRHLDELYPPGGKKLWGAPVGVGFWLTAALFALGHVLAIPAPARLGVFFPALLFAWLRYRTQSLGAAILLHGFANCFTAAVWFMAFGR